MSFSPEPDTIGMSQTDFIPAASPLQRCTRCGAVVDVGDCELLSIIVCPGCGGEMTVRGFIAHFQVLEVAGRGGMGVVYKAHDASLERDVALKLLHKGRSDQTKLIRRLETEAAVTASINHPHVVKVFSTGVDRGRFFLAMELVGKGSLDDLIRLQGRIAESQALTVAIQSAQGLRAVHYHGLIHRDVKPGNILFADSRTAKIVDFGLAIFMEQEESVRGEIWGTPYYVAPEKLDEKPEDFRSDIYSLGATIFHAVAGRPPFEAETPSLVALKHLKAQPVSLQAFAPYVSTATAYVINRTLLKDPEERYQSYDELIEHLEYARNELSAARRTPPTAKRVVLEGEAEQKAWGWVSVAMIGAILLFGAIAWAVQNKLSKPDPALAQPAPAAVQQPPPPPSNNATLFRDAREKLRNGNAVGAAAAFRKIAEQPKLGQPDLNWAILQEGLAESVSERPVEARAAFAKLAKTSAFSSKPEDAKLVAFFAKVAALMQEDAPIAVLSSKELNHNDYEAIGLLLFALKDWQLGRIEEAVAFFRQFRLANPAGGNEWIGGLKRIASGRLEEFTGVQMLGDQLKSAADADQRALIADQLNSVQGALAPHARELLAPFAKELGALDQIHLPPPANGLYKLINRHSGKALDVAALGLQDGADVQQWEETSNPNQQWNLFASGDGTYKIIANHSGKALDVTNAGTEDGDDVRQWTENGGSGQRWKVEGVGRNFYKLTAVCSGKALSVIDRSLENGGNVVQWNYTGIPSQQWRIVPLGGRLDKWAFNDLGKVAISGSATRDDATHTFLIKAGGSDIWDTEDAGHFVQQKITGNFAIVARIKSLEAIHEWSKAGLMVRGSLAPNSRNVFVAISAAHGATQQVRAQDSAITTSAQKEGVSTPCWLKVQRTGDAITGAYSTDGKAWQPLATDALEKLPADVHVGLAVSSHVNEKLTSAAIDSVQLTKLD